MVTAELALAIPSLVAVLILAMGALEVVRAQIQCEQAARAAVRVLARGDGPAAASAVARRLGPAGSSASLGAEGSMVHVSVAATPRSAQLLGLTWSVRGTSVAVNEETPDGP